MLFYYPYLFPLEAGMIWNSEFGWHLTNVVAKSPMLFYYPYLFPIEAGMMWNSEFGWHLTNVVAFANIHNFPTN